METTLALGAFLMIATTAIDIGKAVIFFPVLERDGRRTAVAYLAAMVFEITLAFWLIIRGFNPAAYDMPAR